MHVDIHADAPLAAGDAERQMGALGTDALEGADHVLVARQGPAELVLDPPGNSLDLSRFGGMKAGISDEPVDPPDPQPPDRLGPARDGKDSPSGNQAHLVSSANGENAGDDLLECRAVAFFRKREHGGLR
jgi:hypothetical protein